MTTPFPYATEQFEWAGLTILLATGNTQVPFTASNSDDIFAPTSGGPTPQPQIFIPNSLPFHNNNTYNHFLSGDVIELLIYHQPSVKPSLTLRPFGVLGYVAGHSITLPR